MGEMFAGRYELLDPIAEGGMGSVWRVYDHRESTHKAAKVLRQSDAGSLLRFIREQSMRIDHPHVLTPQSWAGEDDRVLFTMPLVRGGSVATLIGDHGALPLRWVVTLLDQTLQALDAVHRSGIVHRDVKPSNLMLEPTGRAKPFLRLTDFGLAVAVDEPRLTRTSVVLGSAGYIAPEQLLGADPDPRQDLFAVGGVGVEMLTGRRPPYADGFFETIAAPEPVEPGRRLVALLREAMADDPGKRPSSAAELRRRILDLGVDSLPNDDEVEVFDVIGGVEDSAPERVERQPDRRRALSTSLLALVGLACLTGALWILLSL